ncbi:MAG: NADP-dependent oxidoreductase [Flavobacteriaceae bacterium]|nr:NADP-dependent oxidoreductase [Flavobacteriaceae bacterium]MBT5395728.1 NADP-dependent oxidoreductase [Flavobacteriaceae bacterium]MBT5596010.1 NADP-dependent oxidoreductase [Flavobacteriaceae bacterium]MBT7319918.1 NADP-dependent oxidoreductase [Flavobacteriaceae bacterium]MBT7554080.1 NADP-dependent oxidoreductase [Flavobacteriaceae bacterium]
MINKVLRLKKRPIGFPDEDTWELSEEILPSLNEGEILIENNYISLDPAMRGWMNETRSYIEPVKIGDVMRAGSIGKVIESNNPKFSEGDVVSGGSGVQKYSINDGMGFFKIYPGKLDLPVFIGTLGMPGMTAYFGILEVGKIKEGDTVLVSAAAGAVGSIVGQIAKIKGCKVVGIAGGKEKCDYVVNELGFDGCIDYKNESVKSGIKKECPNGIDVYFDNVGGDILDSALIFINKYARIVVCGAISQYNETSAKGPDNYLSLLVNRGTMTGMVVFDYVKKYPIAVEEMSNWILEGKLKSKEDIYDGIENFYEIFKKLFNGDKKGKLILKVN